MTMLDDLRTGIRKQLLSRAKHANNPDGEAEWERMKEEQAAVERMKVRTCVYTKTIVLTMA